MSARKERSVSMKRVAWSIARDGRIIDSPIFRGGYALLVVNSGRHSGIRINDAKLYGPHQYGMYLTEHAGDDFVLAGLTNVEGDIMHEGWPGVRVEGGIRCEGASGTFSGINLRYRAASPLRLHATHPSDARLRVIDCTLSGDHLAVGPLDSADSPLTAASLARRARVDLIGVTQVGRGLYLAAGADLVARDCVFEVRRGRAIEGKFLWGWPDRETARLKTNGVRRPAVVARFVRCRFVLPTTSLPGRSSLTRSDAVRVLWGDQPLPDSIVFDGCTINGKKISS